MAKNKLVKNITIDELAMIINKGFDGQMDYLKKNFETVNENFAQVATKEELDKVKKDVKYIKENLDDTGKLSGRVDYIENILDLPVKKS